MRKSILRLAQAVVVFLSFASFSMVILPSSVGLATAQATKREQAALTLKSTLAQFFKDHDSAKARAGLLGASAIDPAYALPFYELGIVAESQSDWLAAIQWFTKFRQLEANSEYSQGAAHELDRLDRIAELKKTPEGQARWSYDEAVMHGEVLLRLGFLKEAVVEADRAVRIDESRWEAYVLGAQALSTNARFTEAQVYLREALTRSPMEKPSQPQTQSLSVDGYSVSLPKTLSGLFGIPGTRRKIELALQECEKEEHYQGLLKQARAHVQQKKYADAADDYWGALKDYPGRGESALAYGDALAMSGVYDGATKVFTHLRSSPDPAIARHARESLTKLSVLKIVPIPQTEADRLNQLAQTHATEGNFALAQSEYKLAIEDEPNYWQWHANLASLYSRQRRWAAAAAEYARAHILEPKDTGTLTDLGAALLQEHKWPDAIKVYREAVRIEPSNALHHDHLGTSLYYANHRAEAVAEYQQSVKLDPANPSYRSNLAKAQGN